MNTESLDPSFRLAASQVLDERSTQISALARGVLDMTDPEPARKLWLATRRLRAALEVFRPCIGRMDYRTGREEVMRLSRAVGRRREIDVAIETYNAIAAEMAETEAEGIERVIARLRSEQSTANRELAQLVHGRRMQAFRVRIEEIADASAGTEAAERAAEYRPVEVLPDVTIALVSKRLERLRSAAPKSLETESAKAQRGMGVAAERLRYALELTGDALGTQAHTARRAARGLQEILGEIRDCDFAVPPARETITELENEDVGTLLERARGSRDLDPILVQAAPNRAAYRGVELGIVHLLARRRMLYERFKRLWLEQSRQGVWVALETSLKVES
jgi:CHAD domain-containing protein